MTTAAPGTSNADSEPTDLMAQLRRLTRPDHDATEAIPFSQAIIDETLPRRSFYGQLQALYEVHSALESALRDSPDSMVRVVWDEDLAKAPLLQRDLACLDDGSGLKSDHPAIAAAEQFVADIKKSAEQNSVALLGMLYVLEGSTLGATILRTHLGAMYGIDEQSGLAYYSPYGNQVMPHWIAFKQRMNSLSLTAEQEQLIIDAARRAFQHIGAILQALSSELNVATGESR